MYRDIAGNLNLYLHLGVEMDSSSASSSKSRHFARQLIQNAPKPSSNTDHVQSHTSEIATQTSVPDVAQTWTDLTCCHSTSSAVREALRQYMESEHYRVVRGQVQTAIDEGRNIPPTWLLDHDPQVDGVSSQETIGRLFQPIVFDLASQAVSRTILVVHQIRNDQALSVHTLRENLDKVYNRLAEERVSY
jgi:hypothetical protein